MKGSNWRKIWDALREAGEEVPTGTTTPGGQGALAAGA